VVRPLVLCTVGVFSTPFVFPLVVGIQTGMCLVAGERSKATYTSRPPNATQTDHTRTSREHWGLAATRHWQRHGGTSLALRRATRYDGRELSERFP
jgi:hypothetical protein